MRIITHHEDGYIQMSCEVCLVETRASTFSVIFEQSVAMFSTLHASCSTIGRPDFEKALSDYLEYRGQSPTHADFESLLFPEHKPSPPRLASVRQVG